MTTEELIKAQVAAYNRHDVTALTALYAADAALYSFPDALICTGREAIASRMQQRFKQNAPHATVLTRIVMGNFAAYHERITQTVDGVKTDTEMVAQYQVKDGLIVKQWALFKA
jgi:hypothetical protein